MLLEEARNSNISNYSTTNSSYSYSKSISSNTLADQVRKENLELHANLASTSEKLLGENENSSISNYSTTNTPYVSNEPISANTPIDEVEIENLELHVNPDNVKYKKFSLIEMHTL